MHRLKGYYWVKFEGKWTIGYWDKEFWKIFRSFNSYVTEDFDKIGRPIRRQK